MASKSTLSWSAGRVVVRVLAFSPFLKLYIPSKGENVFIYGTVFQSEI